MNFNGHPTNVTSRVRAVIKRAAEHGLVPTATTDGAHSQGSWHYPLKGRNRKGCAVDLGFTIPDLQRLAADQRRQRLTAFQLAEYRYAKRFRFSSWIEILGPSNEWALLNGQRTDLIEGTSLENAHDDHVHVARRPMPHVSKQKLRDARLALKVRRAGLRNGLTVIQEARAADIPVSLALAIVEQESGGRNVFGHDPTSSIPAGWKGGPVTKSRYAQYKRNRSKGGMQGVGPLQLTWWEYQDRADRAGGCWNPRVNIRTGLQILRANMARSGRFAGIRAYNGSGPAAEAYAHSVEARAAKWHQRLTG